MFVLIMSSMRPLEEQPLGNETASARQPHAGVPREGIGDGVVFLLGAPRSGTSLIYKALCMHPDAVWISNWVRTYPSATVLAVANRIPRRFPEMRRRVWFGRDSNAYVYGRRRPPWERAFPMPVEGEPIFEHLDEVDEGDRAAEEPTSKVDEVRYLRGKVRSIRRFAGGSTFVSKRIGNNRRISMLTTAFPGARFVDLIRDGRAVAHSLSRVDWWPDTTPWWHHQTPRTWEGEGGDGWEFCAREWVEEIGVIESGLQRVPSTQRLHLRYEDLIGAPVESLRSVAIIAGLAPTAGWVDQVARLDFPDRNDTWRQRLSATAVRTIEEIQRETLIRHGYDV
jgi:hypothetical protein